MSLSSEEETGISESGLEEYEYKEYEEIKKGYFKVQVSEPTYGCPFCQGKKKQVYQFKDLIQHAHDVGNSRSRGMREKAKHRALWKYMHNYLEVKDQSELFTISESPAICNQGQDQLFVYPWVGIVANIKTEEKEGRLVGESGSKLRDEFRSKGFNFLRVQPIWSHQGHSGFAILEFNKDWEGLGNAILFEKSFQVDRHGKEDYNGAKVLGETMYGWVARDDDYHAKGPVGNHLRKTRDLKTVSQKEAEDQRKTSLLLTDLAEKLESRSKHLKEIESKYMETSLTLSNLMEQKDEIIRSYNEEIKRLQQSSRDHAEKIFLEHNKIRFQLDAQRNQLEAREKELQDRQAQNDTERRKLENDQRMHEKAASEQKKADEKVFELEMKLLELAEKQKKEKEDLHRRAVELEKELDAKQALELEIRGMKGALDVMKCMKGDGDGDLEVKRKILEEDLEEKKEELDNMVRLNRTLMVMERRANDELQEARKLLVKILEVSKTQAIIGIKRMGELDGNPLLTVMKKNFRRQEAMEKAAVLCSQWEARLQDPDWHPFKTIVDDDGNAECIIDEEYEELKKMKEKCGEEALKSVTTALTEMNENNASGTYATLQLWNFKENRKATLKEGVSHILTRWKGQKRMRNA